MPQPEPTKVPITGAKPTFYRVHHTDCPPLSAEHAYSAPWGTTRSANGTRYECVPCDGTGEGTHRCTTCDGFAFTDDYMQERCTRCDDGIVAGCEHCGVEGFLDCDRGYSCFYDPDALLSYFTERFVGGDETVVVFEGAHVGQGGDGEPLVVPERIVETLTWPAFVARIQEAAV